MEQIIERIKSVILSPRDALTAVKTEEWTVTGTMKEYVVIIAAIPAIAQFIGYALIGLPLIGRQHMGRSLVYAALVYILSLVVVVLVGKIINALAPSFGAAKDDLSAFKLAVYAYTPAFVAGVFYLIPSLAILSILGSLYGIYILYIGLPILMGTPKEKTVAYTVVTIIVIVILMVIIGAIAGAIAWAGGAGPVRSF